MSFNSLAQQVNDMALRDRVVSCVNQEARENPSLSSTKYADMVRRLQTDPIGWFIWPVSLASEAEYEYALTTGNPNPGGDPLVIPDAAILGAVQANWPPESDTEPV